jgi:DNA-binding NarL/FixJ family response regulator
MNAEEQLDTRSLQKKVLVVDDHAVVRLGLAKLINEEPDLMVCGEAEDARGALATARQLHPDVAVVDWSFKNGDAFDLITALCRQQPRMPVLVLSIHEEMFYAERAIRAGARGYVMKQEAAGKIVEAIRRVAAGQTYLSERAVSAVLKNAFTEWPVDKVVLLKTLTETETDALRLIAIGYSSTRIAEVLGLRLKDFDALREGLKTKLQLSSTTELFQTAARWVAEGRRNGFNAQDVKGPEPNSVVCAEKEG